MACSSWSIRTLDECATFYSGGTPSKSRSIFWSGTIPWVSAKDLKVFRLYDSQDHVTNEAIKAGSRLVPAGTILLLVRGMTLHNDVPICVAMREMAFNQDIKGLIAKPGIDGDFLVYWLLAKKPSLLSSVDAAGHGTGRLNSETLKAMEVRVPPLPEQRAIASILGSLDDRIELNRQMNETLEGIARALFKSWFVDFDPVRAKMDGQQPAGMAPEIADLFPSEFEHVNGELVPKGWSTGIIGNVGVNPRRSITPEQITMGTPYIALEHMPRRCIALSEWSDSEGISSGKCLFNRGEILFGKLRPYFHKVGVPAVSGVCSTDIIVVVPSSDAWFGFLLGHMSSDALVEYTDLTSTGTKMPRTNWNDIAKYPVVLPPETIAALFADYMRAIVAQIHANVHESKSLSQVRDTLLPKLLSGELRVPDADKMLEEVL